MGASIPSSPGKKSLPEPDINVTPLVDVCLVLLIIFMVIAPAIEHGERVELPAIAQTDKNQKSKLDPLTITVASGERFFIEKEQVAKDSLEKRLQEVHRTEPDRRVVLKGDSGVPYEVMRQLFTVVQKAGFPGVALAVTKKGNANDTDSEEGT